MSASTRPPALELRDIVKRFDGVPALRGASLQVARGTVHGLIGQNGAGKSTLIKILAGIHAADSGTISVNGADRPLAPGSSRAPLQGIGFIHQERLLPATFTVAEALMFGHEPAIGPRVAGSLRLLDVRRTQRAASEALHTHFGVELAPNRLIGELSVAEQQIVQITRALIREPEILVFDEPTAALVSREVDRLLSTIGHLRQRGLTILYVSHYLNEIAAICDRVSVLRDGVDVAHVDARDTPTESLVTAMIGEAQAARTRTASRTPGDPVLQVRNLSAAGRFDNVSFSLRRGEIVGLTGLLGSGGKQVVRSLFGLERGVRGEVEIDGKDVLLRSPCNAARRGIAFVPENRRAHGVAPSLSVRENITLASLARFSRFGLLARQRETDTVRQLIDTLGIRAPGPEAPVRHLSGGNQQKVALGKWLSRGADLASSVYLLDEPTVGVDIGAKAEIYRLLDRLADEGAAVLLFSSDLIELLDITDRVLVMARGRLVRELASRESDSRDVLAWATGARGATLAKEMAA
ncbi:sugar ABC transporter ATP-binding protein [Paraburkholderia sp. MMS20-SJTN17]|uniref:Sugar ABC transporter ATP-binding protein n=1 Tax=Paraburkholderia translucens TaxID=2886945 RepID=A0ABS8KCW8_9BURK|nr:sugar ABC transporter ATP-binding protein [Paraburkholderia sp. MMS20-SJTN17]MCC8402299.1 sugar ABC transporter ATP-binding protein [Paraburkholderia sp. MMS20-SJTN17]